jgi:hypothetical protein
MTIRLAVIDHQLKAIYLSIPKNANTSIKSALLTMSNTGDPQNPHANDTPFESIELNTVRSQKYAKYFRFTFVRNPWDRLLSAWADKCGAESNVDLSRFGMPKGVPFAHFVDAACELNDLYTDVHLRSQVDILHIRGACLPDFIGRFENLKQDWERVLLALKLSKDRRVELPQMQRSAHEGYRKMYNQQMAQKVATRYARDIEFFGYSF